MNDALNDKIKSMGLKFRTISMERNVVQNEQNRLMERCSLLLQNLELKKRAGEKKKNNKNKATFLVKKKKKKKREYHLYLKEMIKKSKEKDTDKTKTKAETRQKESDKATFLKQDKKKVTKLHFLSERRSIIII